MPRKTEIPSPKLREGRIPDSVTHIEPEDIEEDNVSFHFSQYNDKLCEIRNLDTAKARGVLKTLKNAGVVQPSRLAAAGVVVKPIHDRNDYARYYAGIDDGVQLKELVSTSTARIFFYEVGSRFYVTAISNGHRETKKNRRSKRQNGQRRK